MNFPTFFDPWEVSKRKIDIRVEKIKIATAISSSLEPHIVSAYTERHKEIGSKIDIRVSRSQRNYLPKENQPRYFKTERSLIIPVCSDGSTWFSDVTQTSHIDISFSGDGQNFERMAMAVYHISRMQPLGRRLVVNITTDGRPSLSQTISDSQIHEDMLSELINLMSITSGAFIVSRRTTTSARERLISSSILDDIRQYAKEEKQKQQISGVRKI